MQRSARLALATLLAAALPASGALVDDASVASRLDARGVKHEVDADGDHRATCRYAEEDRTRLAFVSGRIEGISGFRVRRDEL